ncbi:MAG: hypothetical protein QHJ81_09825 [Anaerolineae bacterium]|nr:hypothetical protein [Anaerolineae bacterium]
MDRLERDLGERAQVLRLSIFSQTGRAAAARYGVRAVPTFVIFDGRGQPVAQSVGLPNRQQLQTLLETLAGEVGR